jgi:membrane protease YdiL (CAAX protease family)
VKVWRKIWRNKEGRIRLFWRLAGIIGLVFILNMVVWPLLYFVFSLQGYSSTELMQVIEKWSLFIGPLLLLGAVTLFAFVFDKMKAGDMGLTWSRERASQFRFGFVLGGSLVTLVFLLHYTFNFATVESYGWQLYKSGELWIPLASGLLLFLLVSFSEEMLGRGYFINHFAGSSLLAVLLSALFFASLHLLNPSMGPLAFFNIFLVGILFAYMYIWSGSLWMPIGFHLSWNWFMGYIFNYPVSGVARNTGLLLINVEGPELITGGSFGPEASLPVTLFLILGFFLTRRYLQAEGFPCPMDKEIASDLVPVLND